MSQLRSVRPSTAHSPSQPRQSTRRSAGATRKSATKRRAHPPNPPSLTATLEAGLAYEGFRVTNRFPGASRCVAMGLAGTVWTGEADGSISIRVSPLGTQAGHIPAYGRSIVLCLLNADHRMWAGYSDGSFRVFDLDSMKMLFHSTKHTAAVHAMCATKDRVFTAGADWKIYEWDSYDYRYERLYSGHSNAIRSLAAYADPESGEPRLASGSDDGTVRIWAPCGPRDSDNCIEVLARREGGVLSMLVLPDTSELWCGGEDGAICVYDLYSLTCTAIMEDHISAVVSLQQVEETVWSGSKNGSIVVLNRMTKEIVHEAKQTATAAGISRYQPMVIQAVQRTIVYNVWATNPDGNWQCWSCVYPDQAPSHPRGAPAARSAGAGGDDAPEAALGAYPGAANGAEDVFADPESDAYVTEGFMGEILAAQGARDRHLRKSVHDIRESVSQLPAGHGTYGEDEEYPEEDDSHVGAGAVAARGTAAPGEDNLTEVVAESFEAVAVNKDGEVQGAVYAQKVSVHTRRSPSAAALEAERAAEEEARAEQLVAVAAAAIEEQVEERELVEEVAEAIAEELALERERRASLEQELMEERARRVELEAERERSKSGAAADGDANRVEELERELNRYKHEVEVNRVELKSLSNDLTFALAQSESARASAEGPQQMEQADDYPTEEPAE